MKYSTDTINSIIEFIELDDVSRIQEGRFSVESAEEVVEGVLTLALAKHRGQNDYDDLANSEGEYFYSLSSEELADPALPQRVLAGFQENFQDEHVPNLIEYLREDLAEHFPDVEFGFYVRSLVDIEDVQGLIDQTREAQA